MDKSGLIGIFNTTCENETMELAAKLAKTLKSGDIVCLDGELGAGKTVFAKGICSALGVEDYVSSPTFTIVNEYEGTDNKIYHFDMYRLSDESELWDIGFDEYLSYGGIYIVEWGVNIQQALPKKRIEVTIERAPFSGEDNRIINISSY